MEPAPTTSVPFILPGHPTGYASNNSARRYLLEAESTTGFVAWKLADGTTLISNATQVSLKVSAFVSFWACASYKDTTPDGRIVYFDCHDNSLTHLDVRALTSLEYLDCSFNQLTELSLEGLAELQGMDADNNQLANLKVRHLHELRVLNCARNHLTSLNVSGLDQLQILDCSDNKLSILNRDGCTALQEVKSTGNPVNSQSFPS